MKKLTVSIFAAAVMLISAAAPAFAASSSSGSPTVTTLFPDHVITDLQGQYVSVDFTSTLNQGKTIRYWYKNEGDTKATVRLYRQYVPGVWTKISSLTVTPGNAWYSTYTANDADTVRTYRVTIDPISTSSYLNGTIRVAQVSDS